MKKGLIYLLLLPIVMFASDARISLDLQEESIDNSQYKELMDQSGNGLQDIYWVKAKCLKK